MQRLAQNRIAGARARCVYLAEAGIQSALYWYRQHDLQGNGYFSLGRTDIDANSYFILGGTEADLLVVNTQNVRVGSDIDLFGPLGNPAPAVAANSYLFGLTLQNATDTRALRIDRIRVNWNGRARLQQIVLNNLSAWQGDSVSPAECDIVDSALAAASGSSANYFAFSDNMNRYTVTLAFIMADGSERALTVYPAPTPVNSNFTVKSTGRIAGSNIYRTIEAEYNAVIGSIVRYHEINTQIYP